MVAPRGSNCQAPPVGSLHVSAPHLQVTQGSLSKSITSPKSWGALLGEPILTSTWIHRDAAAPFSSEDTEAEKRCHPPMVTKLGTGKNADRLAPGPPWPSPSPVPCLVSQDPAPAPTLSMQPCSIWAGGEWMYMPQTQETEQQAHHRPGPSTRGVPKATGSVTENASRQMGQLTCKAGAQGFMY